MGFLGALDIDALTQAAVDAASSPIGVVVTAVVGFKIAFMVARKVSSV